MSASSVLFFLPFLIYGHWFRFEWYYTVITIVNCISTQNDTAIQLLMEPFFILELHLQYFQQKKMVGSLRKCNISDQNEYIINIQVRIGIQNVVFGLIKVHVDTTQNI